MVSPKITLFNNNATSSGYFAHLIGLNKNIRDSLDYATAIQREQYHLHPNKTLS